MTEASVTTRCTTMTFPLNAPYSTTDTPPPTPHHALNDCESLRSLSLCGSRDVKGEECHMSLRIYDYFSRNSYCKRFCISAEMKPYDRCPGWTVFDVQEEYAKGSRRRRSLWQIVVASSLSWGKSPGAFLHPRWCRFSPQWEVAIYLLFHSLWLQRSLNGLNLPQTFSHFQNTHIHPPILDQGQVKHTLNSTGRIMDMGRLPPLYLVGTSS